MKISYFAALILLIAVHGCAPTNVSTLVKEKGGEQLAPEQILTLVEGNTIELKGYDSDTFLYLDRSGRIFAIDVYNNKDIGQWDVSDFGEFCVRMQNWWYADLNCYQIYEIDNAYKLTGSDGIIKFSAVTYPGDYKNSYRVIKSDRKSIRQSIRSGGALSARAEPVEEEPDEVEIDTDDMDKAISEENTYDVSQENKDLRTTVKWMAQDCPGCNLSDTNLKKADLVGAKLAGANLSGSNLSMANLRRADLEGVNLEDAVLAYCNMPGSNLKNANLKGADLKGANLIRADLSGADLTGADLTGTLLEGIITKGTIGLKRP